MGFSTLAGVFIALSAIFLIAFLDAFLIALLAAGLIFSIECTGSFIFKV
jgi:prepilin signal peptidase PulO-like enzyme (type II secretory pathway)